MEIFNCNGFIGKIKFRSIEIYTISGLKKYLLPIEINFYVENENSDDCIGGIFPTKDMHIPSSEVDGICIWDMHKDMHIPF